MYSHSKYDPWLLSLLLLLHEILPQASRHPPQIRGALLVGRKMDVQGLEIIHHALKAEVILGKVAGKTQPVSFMEMLSTQWV